MVQPFLATSLDLSDEICIIASAVAVPLLAGLVMLNRQEAFRRRRTSSATVTVAKLVAQNAAFIGLVAGFSHMGRRGVLPGQRARDHAGVLGGPIHGQKGFGGPLPNHQAV